MPSGLRRGELAGLQWGDFDFKNLHVNVSHSLVDQHVGPMKTEASRKLSPIDQYVARDLLARYDMTVQRAIRFCVGYRCKSYRSAARKATRVVEYHHERPHPADGSKARHHEEDLVAYLSAHIFLGSESQWRR